MFILMTSSKACCNHSQFKHHAPRIRLCFKLALAKAREIAVDGDDHGRVWGGVGFAMTAMGTGGRSISSTARSLGLHGLLAHLPQAVSYAPLTGPQAAPEGEIILAVWSPARHEPAAARLTRTDVSPPEFGRSREAHRGFWRRERLESHFYIAI